MKNKLLSLALCLIFLLCSGTAVCADAAYAYTVTEADRFCDGILDFQKTRCGAASTQNYIDSALADAAGVSAEFYIIALSQRGDYRFSSYENALLAYLDSNDVPSATSREKYALALIACGSSSRYIADTANEAIGKQGLMSLVFGLHILNNGYRSSRYSVDSLIGAILSMQLADGGWAVMGNNGDVDVTAMVLQSLSPYYRSRSAVTAAVDRALGFLSDRQLESGGFRSMGTENCESSAQVLTALSDLGIDQNTDSRFIKNGSTVIDALLRYRGSDGSFSHTGSSYNETATVQAFYALTAYGRYLRGQGPLYVLDRRNPSAAQTPSATTPSGNSAPPSGGTSSAPSGGSPNQTPSGSPSSEGSSSQTITPIKVKPSEASASAPAAVAEESTAGETLFETTAGEPSPSDPQNDEASLSTPSSAVAASPSSKGGYKLFAILAVVLLSGAIALVLYFTKRRGVKHYIALAVITAAAILVILLTTFESKESFTAVEDHGPSVGSVTLSISCDVLEDEADLPDYLPDDFVFLPTTDFTIADGDTVYDVLLKASKLYDIPIDTRGSGGSAYVAGIGHLYEYAYGDLSGWMYRVNGTFPDVGCQGYRLSDADSIEWLYTKNIGKDL